MPVPICGEIEVGFAGHDDMHAIVKGCNGEPIWRVHAGLCRKKCPGTDAGVRDSWLEGSKQSKQQEETNGNLPRQRYRLRRFRLPSGVSLYSRSVAPPLVGSLPGTTFASFDSSAPESSGDDAFV